MAILLRFNSDGGGLHSERKVLGYEYNLAALGHKVSGDCQDARIVRAIAKKSGWKRCWVGVIELDLDGAALLINGDGLIEPTVANAQVI